MFCSVAHCAMLLAVELEHLSGHVSQHSTTQVTQSATSVLTL